MTGKKSHPCPETERGRKPGVSPAASTPQPATGLIGRLWRDTHWRDTLGYWGMILLGLLAANVFNALGIILLARRVAPLEYGQYVAVLNLATVTSVLPAFGLASWALAQPTAARHFGRQFWYATVGPRLPLFGLWAVLLFAVTRLLSPETYPVLIVVAVLVTVFGENVLLFGYSFLRACNRHLVVTLAQTAIGLTFLGFVLLAPPSPELLLLFAVGRMVIMLAGAAALAVYIHRRALPLAPVTNEPVSRRHEEAGVPRGGMAQAGSFFLADAASVVYLKADITLVGMVLGAAAAGIYGPAANILTMTFLVSQALFFYIVPRLSAQYSAAQYSTGQDSTGQDSTGQDAAGENTSAAETARRAFRQSAFRQIILQSVFGIAVSIVLFVMGPWLVVWLFGVDYAGSIPILQIFSLIPGLRAITFGLAAVLIATQRQPERTVVQMGAAIVCVLATLTVMGPYGLWGVAWVFVGTEILIVAGYLYLVAGGTFSPTFFGKKAVAS